MPETLLPQTDHTQTAPRDAPQWATVRYPTYKASGVEWLGEIPAHWEMVNVKRLAKNLSTVVQTGPFGAQLHASDYVDEGVPLILIRNVKNLWIDDSNIPKITKEKAESLSIYRLEVGDIVFSRVGSIGRIALITERESGWMISGQMLRLRIENIALNKQYLIYAFSSDYVFNYIKLESIGSTRDSINTETLRNCPLISPPLAEQKAIVTYLDRKTAQIDAQIETLSRKAALYRDLRQSLINAVVTGQRRVSAGGKATLTQPDRYPTYKASGVEWLGEIPAHWEVKRLKDVTSKIGSGVTPRGGSEVYTKAGILFLRSQNVYDDGLYLENATYIPLSIHNQMSGSQLKPYDILMNITGASIGRTCLLPLEVPTANINQHISFIRVKKEVNVFFVSLFLKSAYIKNHIQFEQNGASKEAFNLSQIANIPLVILPYQEQKAIATYLDRKTAQIDALLVTIESQCKHLQALRRSLINAVVTGQLKVTAL